MHLDAVEASGKSVARRLSILGDDTWDLVRAKRAGRWDRLEALGSVGLTLRLDRRRRDRQSAAGLEGLMRDAPDMPKLKHDAAARSMHGAGHALPAFDLLAAVDARRRDIALAFRRDLRRFRDDEARACALGIIKSVEQSRHV